jgi:hypothetical protein
MLLVTETRKQNKSMHNMVMYGMIWKKDFMLDVLVYICFLVWDGKHMYSDIQLVCIAFYEMACIWSVYNT